MQGRAALYHAAGDDAGHEEAEVWGNEKGRWCGREHGVGVVAGSPAIRWSVCVPRALLSAVIEAVPCSFVLLVLLLLCSFCASIAVHT